MTPQQAATALKKLKLQPPREQPHRRLELRAACELLKSIDFADCWEKFVGWVDALRDETDAGQRVQTRWLIIARNEKLQSALGLKRAPETCPRARFLPLLQAELLREDAAQERFKVRWFEKARQYREAARREPVPACARWLVMAAGRIENRLLRQIKSMQFAHDAPPPAFFVYARHLRPMPSDKKARQRQANREQDQKSITPAIRSWSTPMSRQDYVAATGLQRRTIERWLKDRKLNLRPRLQSRGSHAADSDKFTTATNLRVLAHWLEREAAHNLEKACGLAAATIACTYYSDRDFYQRTVDTVWPVLKKYRVAPEKLRATVAAHKPIYRPSPSPSGEEILLDLVMRAEIASST